MNFINFKTLKTDRGFVLLYTMLVASLVLLFALGITNTAYKEAILSSSARDAGYSFFAADSGAECALYLINGGTSCFGFNFNSIDDAISISPFNSPDNYCIDVTDVNNRTAIEVRGYNLPCDQKDSPRSVERALKISGLSF